MPSSPSQRLSLAEPELIQSLARAMEDYRAKAARGMTSDVASLRPMGPTPAEARRHGYMSFESMRRIYQRNSIVSAVIDTKIQQVLAVDWAIQLRKRYAGRFVAPGRIEEITDFFENPNPDSSWHEFLEMFLKDYFTIGCGAIEKVRSTLSKKLTELVALDAATIVPRYEAHGRIEKYEQILYTAHGKQETIPFPKEDLIYLKNRPSTYSLWGLSPMESVALEIGSHVWAMNHNASAFTDGNLAENILVTIGAGQGVLDNLKAFWEEHRGQAHLLPHVDLPAGQTGVGATLLKLVGSNRDMEYMQFVYWLFRVVCAAWQVEPNQVILLETMATKASTEEMSEVHQSKSLGPLIKILGGAFTRGVVQEWDSRLEFAFVEEDQLDEETEANVWATMFGAGMPLNELREARGLDPLEGPTVTIDGEPVCVYDLPTNPLTGLPLGYELTEEGQSFGPSDLGGDVFPMDGASSGEEGGGRAGQVFPLKSRKRGKVAKASGRRSPAQPDSPHARQTERAQDAAYRARLQEAFAASLAGARRERSGAARRRGAEALRAARAFARREGTEPR